MKLKAGVHIILNKGLIELIYVTVTSNEDRRQNLVKLFSKEEEEAKVFVHRLPFVSVASSLVQLIKKSTTRHLHFNNLHKLLR